jgi:hypothetical protein
VKVAFAALTVLAVVAFLRNYRFVDAAVSMRRSDRALKVDDLSRAADWVVRASNRVPEDKGLERHAVSLLLQADRNEEAIQMLERRLELNLNDGDARQALQLARVGAAFDRRDYAAMLQEARELQLRQKFDGRSAMLVADAAACVYAAEGDLHYKALAEEWIKNSRDLGFSGPDADAYEDHVRHCLTTRRIMKRDEFDIEFPRGWKGGEQP